MQQLAPMINIAISAHQVAFRMLLWSTSVCLLKRENSLQFESPPPVLSPPDPDLTVS
jgi:hypothetical protein